MNEPRPAVSIVVAVFNDAPSLAELVRRTAATLDADGESFELILVDDGSSDDTLTIVRGLERQEPRLRVFELTRNFGQAAALACGLFAARGDVVVTLDGDLQNPPEEIPKLIAAIQAGNGTATARRELRHESFWRWLGSRFVNRLACRVVGVELNDYGGNFKGYSREVLQATKRIWAPGKPFFPLALWLGFGVQEVTVRHEPRRFGRSRYSIPALLRINFDLITSFTTLPLALLGLAGAVCFPTGIAALLAAWCWAPTALVPALLALALTLSGAIFLSGGLLGIYLGRVYRMVAGGEPPYVVRRGPRQQRTDAQTTDADLALTDSPGAGSGSA